MHDHVPFVIRFLSHSVSKALALICGIECSEILQFVEMTDKFLMPKCG